MLKRKLKGFTSIKQMYALYDAFPSKQELIKINFVYIFDYQYVTSLKLTKVSILKLKLFDLFIHV